MPPWARSQPELLIEPASTTPRRSWRRPVRLRATGRRGAAQPGRLRAGHGRRAAARRARGDPDGGRRAGQPGRAGPGAGGADQPDRETLLARWPTSTTGPGRGFELRQVAGGWRFYTRAQYASYVERFVLDGQQIRLTQAALETLAVVAYKQPVTRSRVAAIRGVNCDGVIKTLVTRGLVEECGIGARVRRAPLPHDQAVPGEARHQQRRRPAVAGAVPARQPRRDRPCPAVAPAEEGPARRPNRRVPGHREGPFAEAATLAADDRASSGCRRCWPRRASVPGAPARS